MKWRIEQLRQKKSPDTEVNDRMDKRKKSPIGKKNYDEVKNRADERTNGKKKRKKIHQVISKSPMAIYNNRMEEKKSPYKKRKISEELKWGKKKPSKTKWIIGWPKEKSPL